VIAQPVSGTEIRYNQASGNNIGGKHSNQTALDLTKACMQLSTPAVDVKLIFPAPTVMLD